MIAGGAAGAIASAFTTPLDVIKTLLNTQETGAGVTRGMREAIIQVILDSLNRKMYLEKIRNQQIEIFI